MLTSSNSTSNSSLPANTPGLTSDENPQFFWINSFQRKAASSTSIYSTVNELKQALLKDLSRAMEIFPVDKFRTDYYFLLIWLAYINLQFELYGDEEECRRLFKMMKSSHIGLHHPEFFLHWAKFELSVERKDKSLSVLKSADEVPILRGNGQIKMIKERIELDKSITLDPLYRLTSQASSTNISNPSSLMTPQTTKTSNLMEVEDYARIPSKRDSSLRTPISADSTMMDGEDYGSSSKYNRPASSVSRLRSLGLGPPKRVTIEEESLVGKAAEEDKENLALNVAVNKSEKKESVANVVSTPTAAQTPVEDDNNSNMSLTMTTINVNCIKEDRNQKSETEKTADDDLALSNNPTTTLNNLTSTTIQIVPLKDESSSTTGATTIKSKQVRINGRVYRVLQLIGRGGSSKVFRVINSDGQIFAMKKVSLKNLDETTINGYINEIELLQSFKGNPHIIQLVDSELNRDQGSLYLLMEYGEADLGRMLKDRGAGLVVNENANANNGNDKTTAVATSNYRCDENFVRFSWEQMLLAVKSVHEAKIVHCDLKPANFLLVQGSLKLIDFGISKAIMNDTTNIVRENQVGTVNYMSPEALQESSVTLDRGKLKIGRPSDVWSLGCILYEMTFGRPPFAHFTSLIQRLHKILDPTYLIEFPTTGDFNPKLISTIKSCLIRNPKERITLPQLLQNSFLRPWRPNQGDAVLVGKHQIQSLLEKFAQAYPGINTTTLTDRIYQQWLREQENHRQ